MDVLGSRSQCCRFITQCVKQTFINCSSYSSNLLQGGIYRSLPKVTALWNSQKYGIADFRWFFAVWLPGKSLSYVNGQLLSFSRKRAVMHVMENCHNLLGMYQPETCIRAYSINKQHLTEAGISCGKNHAEKEPFSGCWSPSGICDLGILRPACCASLQGVCTSLPALSTQNSWVIPQKVHEDGFFCLCVFFLVFFFLIVGCVVMFMSF